MDELPIMVQIALLVVIAGLSGIAIMIEKDYRRHKRIQAIRRRHYRPSHEVTREYEQAMRNESRMKVFYQKLLCRKNRRVVTKKIF